MHAAGKQTSQCPFLQLHIALNVHALVLMEHILPGSQFGHHNTTLKVCTRGAASNNKRTEGLCDPAGLRSTADPV